MPGQTYKLVLIGESGAGKTTCIASVSDIPPMSTDVPHIALRSSDKTTTTVAFDYGEMILDEDHRLLLYGLPGQSEFDFMFSVVQEGVLGVVVVVDALSDAPLRRLAGTLRRHAAPLQDTPLVVVINKASAAHSQLTVDVIEVLKREGLVGPVLSADLRERSSIAAVFHLITIIAEYRHG